MKLTLKELATLFPKNTLECDGAFEVASLCQDTRKIAKGDVYIAISGDNFDGHDFIGAAFEKGAVATLVSKSDLKVKNCFYCEDTVAGLGKIASYYRDKFSQPLIAITGSNGKTTTKEYLAHVLSQSGPVIATVGNLNNHIGVPLTISRFDEKSRYFVVEMGMNHAGEIRYLAKIAKPTIALITGVGHAHMEGVGGKLTDVAQAKGELFEELDASVIAIVNADDPHVVNLPTKAKRVTFGLAPNANIRAENLEFLRGHTKFTICHGNETHPVKIQMTGYHHVRNALAVFAICKTLGLATKEIIAGLESFNVDFNRGRILEKGRVFLVDDTYNANPDSMRAAFESLALQFPKTRKIAVLGGMLELGSRSSELHLEVGTAAKSMGLDEIFTYGGDSIQYLKGFGYSESEIATHSFTTHDTMAEKIAARLKSHSGEAVLLLKGSRGMKMEKVLERLLVIL
jgi:UDP-N-acetylmuramoyl-tripeptide--D-alanyl-D-alanine ligase